MAKTKKQIITYTDGGCRNHGNVKGGHVKKTDSAAWAYLIQYPNGVQLHQSGYAKGKTNNQMELRGVIEALSTITNRGAVKLSEPDVVVVTDSAYIYNAFTKGWIKKWQAKKFHKVKNADYWRVMLFMISRIGKVIFKWTKGHAENQGNNFVDHLLNRRMDITEAVIKKQKQEKEDKKKQPKKDDK